MQGYLLRSAVARGCMLTSLRRVYRTKPAPELERTPDDWYVIALKLAQASRSPTDMKLTIGRPWRCTCPSRRASTSVRLFTAQTSFSSKTASHCVHTSLKLQRGPGLIEKHRIGVYPNLFNTSCRLVSTSSLAHRSIPRFSLSVSQARSSSTNVSKDDDATGTQKSVPSAGCDHGHKDPNGHSHSHSIFYPHSRDDHDHTHTTEQIVHLFEGKGTSSFARFLYWLNTRHVGDRGSRITLLGLVVNVGLTGAKGLAGWYMHSASLLADAGHSLSGACCPRVYHDPHVHHRLKTFWVTSLPYSAGDYLENRPLKDTHMVLPSLKHSERQRYPFF